MITQTERSIALACLDFAREAGAQKARITLNKSTEDLIATLDGEVDKVTRCADRSLSIALFVDGRFGTFSVNKMEAEALRDFIFKAADTVRMLAPDACRTLPDPARCCTSAVTGTEMDIYDPSRESVTPSQRREAALAAAVAGRLAGKDLDASLACGHEGMRLISEEGEYSDSVFDTLVVDSQGLECIHSETSFDYGVEVTVEDAEGNKYSDYWWTSSPRLAGFDASDCGFEAIRRACAQAGSAPAPSEKYNMVVSRDMASRLVSPLLNALNGYSIQQGNSFLVGTEGRQVFSTGLSIVDEPWRKGEAGSKLFDGEAPLLHKHLYGRQTGYRADRRGCNTAARVPLAVSRTRRRRPDAAVRRGNTRDRLQRRQLQYDHRRLLLRDFRPVIQGRAHSAPGQRNAHHRQFPGPLAAPARCRRRLPPLRHQTRRLPGLLRSGFQRIGHKKGTAFAVPW